MKTTLMTPGQTRSQYLKTVRAWIKRQYDKRRESERCHVSHTACDVMRDAEKRFPDLGTFGVEGWCDDCGRDGVSYLNSGDTYEHTIFFRSSSERFTIGDLEWHLTAWERSQR